MPLMGFQNMQLHVAREHDHGDGPEKWEKKCVVRRGTGLRTLHTNITMTYLVRYNKIVRHKYRLSKSLKGSKCGKLSTERNPRIHYTCVGSQEKYYQKITCKREPLRYSDKDIHVQINQEDKLIVLGSELERTQHINFSVSHKVKIPVQNKKKILVGCDLQRPKTTKAFKKEIDSGASLVKAKLITIIY